MKTLYPTGMKAALIFFLSFLGARSLNAQVVTIKDVAPSSITSTGTGTAWTIPAPSSNSGKYATLSFGLQKSGDTSQNLNATFSFSSNPLASNYIPMNAEVRGIEVTIGRKYLQVQGPGSANGGLGNGTIADRRVTLIKSGVILNNLSAAQVWPLTTEQAITFGGPSTTSGATTVWSGSELIANPLVVRLVVANGNSHATQADISYIKVNIHYVVVEHIVTPLTWVSFQGKKNGKGVQLDWETADEVNTQSFAVERSTDGKSWKTIGTLASLGQSRNNYTFSDDAPLTRNYYRIQQIDIDGQSTYSKTVTVATEALAAGGSLGIAPNPAAFGRVSLTVNDASLLSGEVLVKVTDLSGKIVYLARTAAAPTLSVVSNGFKPGLYLVSVQNLHKAVSSKLLVP
ncbi:T9SS type A sorting domain-containing protein [Paraflavisolibacter sp. H34]|uniref:T9SS type A sorting domain-containing protein n=1 Tax=Huijunlia imazamoxiresistens TaxID=3127457 RepID=UPI00301B3848